MGLSLLAPLALALAALGALPVVAHLSRQTPRERRAFGAMLLLERMVKRLRRRRRIKDWPLLLLRLAAVMAVVLAAGAPELRYPGALPEYGGSGRVVFVVDNSLSMSLQDGGQTLLERQRTDALAVLNAMPAGALAGLVVFSDEAERITPTLTSDHDRIESRLQAVAPSHGRSNLRSALLEARRLLGGEAGEVLVFTDEAGAEMVTDAQVEIERMVAAGGVVIPQVRRPDPPRNVAVLSAVYGDGPEGGEVTVRIANYGDAAMEVGCEVSFPDGATVPIFADLPPEGETEERITVPVEVPGGVGRAWCEDPDLTLDDARYFHVPRVGASRVLVVDGDPGDTPTRSEVYFLERALAPWGGLRSGVTLDVTSPAGLSSLDPDTHRVVFLANVSDPRPFALSLAEFVRGGGSLVVSGGDNVTPERYNAALPGLLPAPIRRVRSIAERGEEGLALALPEPDGALFAPFSRSGRSGFSRVRAHTLMTLEPYKQDEDVRTWLSYENGMPALVERRVGSGRVMLWTGTVDLAWGNFPLQAVFMPLTQRIVGWLGGEAGTAAERLVAQVGLPVAVELPEASSGGHVLGPDGTKTKARLDGSKIAFTPDRPGPYAVNMEDGTTFAWVAVNTDPTESDVRPGASIAETERNLAPELLERRVELARPAMLFALGLLFVQGVVAMRGLG